jgi:hypothetical protein
VSGGSPKSGTPYFSFLKTNSPARPEKEASAESELRNRKVSGRTRPRRSAPVLGRSNWLHSRHRTFPNCSPITLCCGRDGRTPLMQKFNFGIRVENINADSTGQNFFLVKIGRANK